MFADALLQVAGFTPRGHSCTIRYMITDCAIDIDASAPLVWDVFSDVERWPDWTASVTSLKALDGPGLAIGRRFEIKQPRLPKLVWEGDPLAAGGGWGGGE